MRGTNKPAQAKAQQSTQDSDAWLAQDGTDEAVAEVMDDSRPVREVMRTRLFNDEELSAIDSWDYAMATAIAANSGVANAADVLGTGFRIATEDDKLKLQDVPLLLLEWSFNPGDFGDDFVSISAIQRHDSGGITKWVINDGGTGIREQLRAYQQKTGAVGGLYLPKGLRVSSYYIDADTRAPLTKAEVTEAITSKRKIQPAHTFYLNTSA